MTETCSAGTANPKDGPDKPGSIGLPLPGIELDIVSLDDPAKVLALGEVGEIRIKGPNVTKGYWNRPEETAAAFVDGWFLTGDVGYMDEDGYFFIVDRKKDMIISGGFNVYPQMIEQAIYEHPAVQEVHRHRHPRRLSRRGGQGFRQIARRRRSPLRWRTCAPSWPARSASTSCPPRSSSGTTCRGRPSGKLSRHELRVRIRDRQDSQAKESNMDLRYSKEEIAFREEVRDFFQTAVPAETRKKLQEGRHLSKQDMVEWQRILNKKGWAVPHWPKEWGGTGWDAVQALHLQ